MPDEPTLGEAMRQLQALVRQVESLVQEIRSDYVRKDLYDARHSALTRRVDQLDGEVDRIEAEADQREDKRQAFQRQIVAGIIIGVVVMLAQTAVTVLLLLGGIR